MKLKNTLWILLLLSFSSYGYEKRNLLQTKANLQQVRSLLIPNNKWITYPAYTDRAGWDRLSGAFREAQIKKAEQHLHYEWKAVRATDYIEFEKTGSRSIMESPFGANASALSELVVAELCEGEGRFMDQIINGVWIFSEMTSWALSAHLPAFQKSKRSLPDYKEHVIDLTAGDMGSMLAWIYYFFKEPFDRVDPVIAERLKAQLKTRILDTYMARSDFWWQAFNLAPGGMVNNWNPWCNFNVLTCFLLLEDDPGKRAAGVYRTMVSTDEFINYTHTDGACEEGPSYWGHAAGKLYDYLQLLSYATDGRISVFDEAIVRNMGEYIANSYVGNGWVVNFADASAKGGGSPGVIYRYGKAVNSEKMVQFAAYLLKKGSAYPLTPGRDLFRYFEDLASYRELPGVRAGLPVFQSVWYPQTEFCYIKNEAGFFFAAKGGHNAESHNHNDIGTFSLYIDQTPVFIDAGVGTYTRQTFSRERYSIWTMQSNFHNLPLINGIPQRQGKEFCSRGAAFDEKKSTFSLDIAGAYPPEAGVNTWKRSYTLSAKGTLEIEDDFMLTETKAANRVNFLVWQQPDISQAGAVRMTTGPRRITLRYDPKLFTAHLEIVPISDRRLSSAWGDKVFQLSLETTRQTKKGKYRFVIAAEESAAP